MRSHYEKTIKIREDSSYYYFLSLRAIKICFLFKACAKIEEIKSQKFVVYFCIIMGQINIKEELLGLENLLNNFVYETNKHNKRKRKAKTKKDFFILFKQEVLNISLDLYFVILGILPALAYRFNLLTTNSISNYSILLILISIVGLTTLFLYRAFKVFKDSLVTELKIEVIKEEEIEKSNIFIEQINKYSSQSVARFEEKLKDKIEKLNENIKKHDSIWLPISILIMIATVNYILGFNVTTFFGKNISLHTGGLNLIAAIIIVIKALLLLLPNSKIDYCKEFLLILKEAQIERSN